jgi:hypothetical protein
MFKKSNNCSLQRLAEKHFLAIINGKTLFRREKSLAGFVVGGLIFSRKILFVT